MKLQCISKGITRLVNDFHCNSRSPEGAGSQQDGGRSTSVAVLLYTPSCFESPRGGNYRYKPMPGSIFTTPKGNARLAQLWEELLANPVPPDPAAMQPRTVAARFKLNDVKPLPAAPDRERPSRLRMPDMAPAIRVMEGGASATTARQEAERKEPILLSQDERAERVSRNWRANLATWLHSLVELEDAGSASPSADEANSEAAAFSEMSIEAAHDASLSLSSPFRWEPKQAWTSAPVRSNPPFLNTTDPRRFAPRPKIPVCPLHKQPFYRRFFFYLHRWLSTSAWQETDPAAR